MNCGCRPNCCTCGYSHYGCFSFLFDLFMIGITGGIWAIWIFIREMRRQRRC